MPFAWPMRRAPKGRTISNPKLRLGFAVVAATAVVTGCARDDIAGGPGPGGEDQTFEAARVVDQFLSENDLGDAGYGASIMIDDPAGERGAVSFQSVVGRDATELRLLSWDTRGDETDLEMEQVAVDTGDITVLKRSPTDGTRYIASSRIRGSAHDLALYVGEGGGWTEEVLDIEGDVGRYLDMEIDADGAVHIAYLETGDGQLRYLVWLDGALIQEPTAVDTGFEDGQVTPGGDLDFAVSLDLDSDGAPHVSYYDATNGQLRYAHRDPESGNWVIQVIGTYREARVVAVQADGTVALPEQYIPRESQVTVYENLTPLEPSAYQFESDEELTINDPVDGAEYTMDYVTPVGSNYGTWSSLAVGDGGRVYISFFDFNRGRLVVAENSDPTANPEWELSVVEQPGVYGDYNALTLAPVIDEQGVRRGQVPVVAYQDTGNADLMMAYRLEGVWEAQRLDTPGLTGFNPTLAATAEGRVLIAYRELIFGDRTSVLHVRPFLPTGQGG